ncbi:MAG: hypothetical protein MUE81_10995 [Thermoflexibacter sp.]|jgi:hypothetical protein|nr:hypothetical protein [Thermoflexibacter sp.]
MAENKFSIKEFVTHLLLFCCIIAFSFLTEHYYKKELEKASYNSFSIPTQVSMDLFSIYHDAVTRHYYSTQQVRISSFPISIIPFAEINNHYFYLLKQYVLFQDAYLSHSFIYSFSFKRYIKYCILII